MLSPEMQSKIAAWRLRAAEGTLTQEEMKEVIITLRQGRLAAGQAAKTTAAKRKKAFAEIPVAGDMLSEIEDL